MVARFHVPCPSERLQLALEARLTPREQLDLETHLQECDSCRESLEALAGDASWWDDARSALADAGRNDRCSSRDSSLHSVVVRALDGDPSGATSEFVAGARADDAEQAGGSARDADEIGGRLANSPILRMLEPSQRPESLGRLGAYEVTEVLGRGGSGIVLKGFDAALNRHVAIKVLAAELAASASARRRFAREAQAAAAVVHEHVVSIHAIDAAAGFPYLVMSYIPGKSLQDRLDRDGPLGLKEILRIGMQTAAGLAAAHAQGLVHRDIKPANILLENGVERVKITDFGLARAVDDASQTQSGVVAGTPQYMAPEQARGEAVDHRADLFCLGSVLYAMATGRSPFRAENTLAVLRRVCEDEPRSLCEVNPDLPAWFERLVGLLMKKDPAQRLQSAAEVAELLEQCLAHVQQPQHAALPASVAVQPKSNRRRGGRAVVVAGLFALLAIAVASWPLGWFERLLGTEPKQDPSARSSSGELSIADVAGLEVEPKIVELKQHVSQLEAEFKQRSGSVDRSGIELAEIDAGLQSLEAMLGAGETPVVEEIEKP